MGAEAGTGHDPVPEGLIERLQAAVAEEIARHPDPIDKIVATRWCSYCHAAPGLPCIGEQEGVLRHIAPHRERYDAPVEVE